MRDFLIVNNIFTQYITAMPVPVQGQVKAGLRIKKERGYKIKIMKKIVTGFTLILLMFLVNSIYATNILRVGTSQTYSTIQSAIDVLQVQVIIY